MPSLARSRMYSSGSPAIVPRPAGRSRPRRSATAGRRRRSGCRWPAAACARTDRPAPPKITSTHGPGSIDLCRLAATSRAWTVCLSFTMKQVSSGSFSPSPLRGRGVGGEGAGSGRGEVKFESSPPRAGTGRPPPRPGRPCPETGRCRQRPVSHGCAAPARRARSADRCRSRGCGCRYR